ncbi:septal ring assembly protein ZapB [Klebsiella grimontii]|uniref:Cell division protein ZapB n=1 Tax=Klebsiella grimontii TaxID=2058152 RepID=A0A7H4NUE2_9ENTR|nr:septal ring assembly protein ZapB [Klebsiella grimontii]
MSLEVFEKLESKVQQAIDTITLLQMEIEELKEKNNTLAQEVQSAQHSREELERENGQLKEQQQGWQDRLQALLGRMEESNASRPLPFGRGQHFPVLYTRKL